MQPHILGQHYHDQPYLSRYNDSFYTISLTLLAIISIQMYKTVIDYLRPVALPNLLLPDQCYYS